MANRRIQIDQLETAVNSLLEEYTEDIREELNEIVSDVTKQGVKELKSKSRSSFDGTGKYASGWTSKTETGRVSAQGTIYNQRLPGLPHLLEHGHANRGGGRTPGRVHIATVEDKVLEMFVEKVKSKL